MTTRTPVISEESEPRFPPDLEREIFEICALSRPATIPSLILVASRVKDWVEPLLYRIVAVANSKIDGLPSFPCDTLLRTIREKPAGFLARYVRHLYLKPGRRKDRAHCNTIFLACPGVTDLFFTDGAFHEPDFLTQLEGMPNLHQLAIDVGDFFVPDTGLEHRLFRNITHLEALSEIETPPANWAQLSYVPNLTHFSFWQYFFLDHVAALLIAYPQLQCVAFLAAHPSTIAAAATACASLSSDPRFVAVLLPHGYELGWMRGALLGESYWARADAFLAAKRAGGVDSSEYRC